MDGCLDIRDEVGFKMLQSCSKEDGAIIVDCQSYKLAVGNFMVTSIGKGDRHGGGARHRSASAISQQANGNYVIKASEDACGSASKNVPDAALDVFCGSKEATKEPLSKKATKELPGMLRFTRNDSGGSNPDALKKLKEDFRKEKEAKEALERELKQLREELQLATKLEKGLALVHELTTKLEDALEPLPTLALPDPDGASSD